MPVITQVLKSLGNPETWNLRTCKEGLISQASQCQGQTDALIATSQTQGDTIMVAANTAP